MQYSQYRRKEGKAKGRLNTGLTFILLPENYSGLRPTSISSSQMCKYTELTAHRRHWRLTWLMTDNHTCRLWHGTKLTHLSIWCSCYSVACLAVTAVNDTCDMLNQFSRALRVSAWRTLASREPLVGVWHPGEPHLSSALLVEAILATTCRPYANTIWYQSY